MESKAVFDEISHMQASFGPVSTHAVTAEKRNFACTSTGICTLPTAIPLRDTDHTHVHTHMPFLHESVHQNKNLTCAAAIFSSMGKR